MNKRIKAPVIRFRGFSDNWKQSTFGDLAGKFEYGLNASATKYDGENKYIRITDIDDVTHKFLSANATSPDADLLSADNFLLNEGDILFARTGASVGKSYQYDNRDGKLYFAGFLIRARIRSDSDTNFVFQNTLTSNYKKFVKITSQRSGQPGINAQEFRMFKIKVPSIEEQIKIGKIFKQIDNLLVLQQQLLNDHKQLKKAMLQKMIPQKGENVPRVRFAGFTDDWKKKKLKEIGKTQSGIGFPENEQGGTKGIPFYKVSDMNIKGNENIMEKSNNYVNEKQINKKSWKPIEDVPAIIFAKVGAAIMLNRKRLVYEKFFIDNNVMAYIFNDNWDVNFGQAIFNTLFLPRYAQVGALPSFNSSDIDTIEILIPVIEEQEKIGNFFKQLDETIELHEKKLETYQSLKKAMLQKMFV